MLPPMTRGAIPDGGRFWSWFLLAGCALVACKRGEQVAPGPSSKAATSASAPPVDRLAPGELAPGQSQVFGFEVPRQMKILSQSPDRALLEGEVSDVALIDYVRERVEVVHVEIGAGRTIFPKARIKNGLPDRLYQVEVVPNHRRSSILIQDVTPKPVEHLTPEERWKRAGRTPDGKPIDIGQLR